MYKEQILSYWNECLPQKQQEFRLALQCAPVLKGVSVGNVVSLEAGIWEQSSLPSVFCSSEVNCLVLWKNERRVSLLLYRRAALNRYLQVEQVSALMQELGYEDVSAVAVLWEFSRRYCAYMEKQCGFPHELGLLLGYPAEDVKGYIAYHGRDFIMAGYWKVYESADRAEQLFQKYDAARLCAAHQAVHGCSLSQMIEP